MNLAVKLYKDIQDAPVDIPALWPAEVIELGNSLELPDSSYTLMTVEEYNAYREEHLPAYTAYSITQD